MTLTDLRQLIATQDAAQREAAELARPAHTAALQAAQELRDKLDSATAPLARRTALKALIEAAAGKMFSSKQDKQAAGLLAQQYGLERAAAPGPGASVARDGVFLLRNVVASTSSGYTPEERARIYAALVVAASGGADVGLMRFTDDWAQEMTIDSLEAMAEALDSGGADSLLAEHQSTLDELTTVRRAIDALEQGRPRLFVVKEGEDASTVTIRNHRGGSVGMNGVTFQHGDNEFTTGQLDKIRGNSTFAAYLEEGTLEIMTASQLVEEV